jgi:hypothetical protein
MTSRSDVQMMHKNANLTSWKPGQSGNPNGRPVGSRTAFSEGFHRDLAAVWTEKGKAAIEHTAEKQPALFFSVCARLIPNDVRVTVEQQLPAGLNPEDWALLREVMHAVKVAIPDAGSKQPGEVFQIILSAIERHLSSE